MTSKARVTWIVGVAAAVVVVFAWPKILHRYYQELLVEDPGRVVEFAFAEKGSIRWGALEHFVRTPIGKEQLLVAYFEAVVAGSNEAARVWTEMSQGPVNSCVGLWVGDDYLRCNSRIYSRRRSVVQPSVFGVTVHRFRAAIHPKLPG